MNRRSRFKLLFTALCVGWCFLFLRCETTEKSMVRAVYLARTETGTQVLLWYQAPEASADASEASAAVQAAGAEGDTLEKALSAAEEALPQAADYRLCDYLLTTPGGADALLADYEQLVLARKCGRTAARVSCTRLSGEDLLEACEKQGGFADKLLEKLKAHSAEMPRLYQHRETMLLPLLCRAEEDTAFEKTALLQTGAGQTELPEAQAEMARLLAEQPGAKTFWLDEKQVKIRRCSVSVTLDKNAVCLRLDAQLAAGEPQPAEAQRAELEALTVQTVHTFWQQGADLLALGPRRAVQAGTNGEMFTTKNACPEIRADVHFLGF